jgi:diacylglycerol kinase
MNFGQFGAAFLTDPSTTAKDLGSAAVFTALGMSAPCWGVIAGLVLLRWLSALR